MSDDAGVRREIEELRAELARTRARLQAAEEALEARTERAADGTRIPDSPAGLHWLVPPDHRRPSA
ncbi:hypothetical protein [Thermomonospora cellulosilytica]|uniref:Septal ring factor EnvC (AmiA/AmiB activator) n=1 Tax=Thermomonospora cellulosilytica TaxID=1411118 RepID=A0A7W3MZT1_9ACTN|nr:hypothetical protein [Thermomonospora cellulosilytica]MBA9004884.1 septal ring factor EnvC (AmiA/AmiB activator) [Thermomonospora cellulosilytica]